MRGNIKVELLFHWILSNITVRMIDVCIKTRIQSNGANMPQFYAQSYITCKREVNEIVSFYYANSC
jgi:hypothetical protein